MSLEKMKLVAYSDESYQSQVGEYTVMLNPESLKVDCSINYDNEQPPNSSAPSSKYKYSPAANISFELFLDCTGIVDETRVELPEEITKLKKIIYDYNGDIHRPNYVSVIWGKHLNFQGVLTSYTTSYTLFKPDGTPLRAKISLAFDAFKSREAVTKEEKNNSPDMTHLVAVVEGDSLPQLSKKIWGDTAYYIQVARFNNLNKFRKLQAGTTLTFPPLVTEAS